MTAGSNPSFTSVAPNMALGVATTHFMGTHTGSAVGLILAARVPERLITLVLEGPH